MTDGRDIRMIDLLDYSVILVFLLVVIYNIIRFKLTYFPKKSIYSENLMNTYINVKLHRRFQHNIDNYLQNEILKGFINENNKKR
jgi:hypothetical protein